MSEGYGEGRPDVQAMMRKATRTERPTRRTRPVPDAPPEGMFRRRPGAAQAPADRNTTGRVKLNFGEGPVIPLALLGAGMYLAWFGVHYWRSDVRWPTDPVKNLLQGKPLPSRTGTPTADQQAVLAAAKAQLGGAAIIGATGPQGAAANAASANQAPGVTPGSGQPAANVNTGKLLAAAYGWGPGSKDWPYLYSGWMEESGWRTDAAYDKADPYNHAYGIPQSNPGTKMASAGPNWKTDAATQIKWGLAYIKGTYGAPSRVPGWTPNGPAAGYQGY